MLLQALEYEDALLSRGVPSFSFTILATRTFFYCNWIASCIVLSTMAIKQNKQKKTNIAPERYYEPWAFLCVVFSPHLVISFRQCLKHPRCTNSEACCQPWEGLASSSKSKVFGVFSLATSFPAIQLRSQGCSKLHSKWLHQPARAPCVLPSLPSILFLKCTTTPLRCKSTARVHPPLTSLSPVSFQICCSLFTALTDHAILWLGGCISTGSRNQRGSHILPPSAFVVGLSSPPLMPSTYTHPTPPCIAHIVSLIPTTLIYLS